MTPYYDADARCRVCGDRPPHRFQYLVHAAGRLRWAARTARHANPKTLTARLRLLWHDLVIHGLLHRGRERCQDCGRAYPAWNANTADWLRVMGAPSGLLCASCFGATKSAAEAVSSDAEPTS